MAQRFFTADFHLGMQQVLQFENRPFQTIGQMNRHLLDMCKSLAKPDDMIIHVGDLATFGMDRGMMGLDCNVAQLVSTIPSTFVNLRGNHDISNRVKSLAISMRTALGKRYPNVSVSHYPSYDVHARGHWMNGDIHLCGHVHSRWKHCLDLTGNVLNINVGVDAWGYRIVSEEKLIEYIDSLFKKKPDSLDRCRTLENGKVQFFKGETYDIANDK